MYSTQVNSLLRLLGELVEVAAVRDTRVPPRHRLVHNLYGLELLQRRRHHAHRKRLAVDLVGYSDLDLVEVVEDVQLGDVDRRIPGKGTRGMRGQEGQTGTGVGRRGGETFVGFIYVLVCAGSTALAVQYSNTVRVPLKRPFNQPPHFLFWEGNPL